MFKLKYTLCRTCLEAFTQTSGFNIFIIENLAEKLISCTGQPVVSTDEYPDQLCQKCYENVIIFYEFQEMCRKSLEKFLDLLKSEQKNERSSQNYESENFIQDSKKQKSLYETNMEQDNYSQTSINILKKKKKSRKSGNKLQDQNLEIVTVTKQHNSGVSKKVISRDKTKNDLEEYLQFDKEDKVSETIENNVVSRLPLNEQDEVSAVLKDLQVGEELHKKEEGVAQEVEKIFLIDTRNCESEPDQTYTEKQEHQCHRCSLKFKTIFKLEVHLRQHDGLPPYLCSFKGCTCSFDQWQSYKKHLKGHNDRQQSFQCDIDNCERVYKTKSNLNIHKRKFHNFGPELKKHMCEICGKVFKSSAVLNDHKFTHIDKAHLPYACEEEDCNKRFSTKERLKVHKMRHAGIKNFVCPYCGMRKTTRNELKIHINYHTLERTWPCRFCSKVCNSAGNLKMHIKNIHEGAKDFACRFCERTFAKADTKKYHEMTHTGEKPNECKECGRRFVQPAALRTHRKIHLRQKEKLADKPKCKGMTAEQVKFCIAEYIDKPNLLTESIVTEILNDDTNS